MALENRGKAGVSASPLVDLEAELRAIDRRRREAVRAAETRPARQFDPARRITPGSWADLENAVAPTRECNSAPYKGYS